MAHRCAKIIYEVIIYEVCLIPNRSAALASQVCPPSAGAGRGLPDGRSSAIITTGSAGGFFYKKAVAESNSATADVSVPNLRSKGAHASPSLLAHAAGRGREPAKAPRAASCLLMGSRPQWPPFGAKPRSCKYSYGVSPGLSPGSF